jgi:hypothetical protein
MYNCFQYLSFFSAEYSSLVDSSIRWTKPWATPGHSAILRGRNCTMKFFADENLKRFQYAACAPCYIFQKVHDSLLCIRSKVVNVEVSCQKEALAQVTDNYLAAVWPI